MADKAVVPFLGGESRQIGGLKVVYLPDWLTTRFDCPRNVIGVLMPVDLADAFLDALRKAGAINEALARKPAPSKEPLR